RDSRARVGLLEARSPLCPSSHPTHRLPSIDGPPRAVHVWPNGGRDMGRSRPDNHRRSSGAEAVTCDRIRAMNRILVLSLSCRIPAVAAPGQSGGGDPKAGVRILLGLGGQESTRWDGSLRVTGARVSAIEPWRFEQGDSIEGTSWKASTHPPRLFGGGQL